MEKILLEFYHTLNPISLELLMKESISFLVKNFNLVNASLYVLEKRASFTENQEFVKIEKIASNHLKETKSTIITKNISKDILFKNINLSYGLIAYPLSRGMLCLYFEKMPNLDTISKLVRILEKNINVALLIENSQNSAKLDALTNLYNRAFFFKTLKRELEFSKKTKRPVSLLLIDLDNFKQLNDTKGHLEGDKLLRKVAEIIIHSVRETDIPCRYGGDEFAVVLPNTTLIESKNVAKRILKNVLERTKMSLSIGSFTAVNGNVSASRMIEEADKMLYKAKKKGKSRIQTSFSIHEGLNAIEC